MTQKTTRRLLAENLRILRLLRRLSQEELAELVDLDRSYIGGIERAQRNVSLDNLEKMANALGITIPELLREPDPRQLADQLLEAVRRSVGGEGGKIREERAIYALPWPPPLLGIGPTGRSRAPTVAGLLPKESPRLLLSH